MNFRESTLKRQVNPMSDTVLAALIGAAASIIVNLISNASRRKKRAIDEAVKEERLQNRLASIEGKLDEHNGYAKLFSQITTDIAVIKNDIKNLYKST